MKHVFVETNWVFEFCAPAHRAAPEAAHLARRAAEGELVLHLPAICLREGANAIRQKCQPTANKELQEFRRWAVADGHITAEVNTSALVFLDAYVNTVNAEMAALEGRIGAVGGRPNLKLASRGQQSVREGTLRPVRSMLCGHLAL